MGTIPIDIETFPIDDAATYVNWEPVAAPAHYKDPEKIAAYIAAGSLSRLEKCALDPDLCRIVAVGFQIEGENWGMACRDETDEREALRVLWGHWMANSTFVTFNGVAFDIPVLLRRSLYLDVKAPSLTVDKYRHPQIVDLLQLLSYHGALPWHSLNFYTQRFGLPVGNEDVVSGADISELVIKGDWDTILLHCLTDVTRTANLARRIGAMR